MSRLARRALLLLGTYVTVLAAVVVAGFLAGALGIWAAILWGVGILTALLSTCASAGISRAATARKHDPQKSGTRIFLLSAVAGCRL